MKFMLACAVLLAAAVAAMYAADPSPSADQPQFTKDNELTRPENYRDWVFLSSGLGMNYSPQAGGHEMFTNVFVPRASYDTFLKSGKWPDKTMFVVEERGADSKFSINKHGHYQTTELMGIGVEVKDEARFPEKWAYFAFDEKAKTASATPKEGCWTCHENHAAVEHTFVQFYPTLKPVAEKFGTYRAEREKVD
jgi:hypothetical protein